MRMRVPVGNLSLAEEIDVSVLEEVPRELVVETYLLAPCDPVVNHDAGDEDRGEDRGDDTDDEGACKSLDRT